MLDIVSPDLAPALSSAPSKDLMSQTDEDALRPVTVPWWYQQRHAN